MPTILRHLSECLCSVCLRPACVPERPEWRPMECLSWDTWVPILREAGSPWANICPTQSSWSYQTGDLILPLSTRVSSSKQMKTRNNSCYTGQFKSRARGFIWSRGRKFACFRYGFAHSLLIVADAARVVFDCFRCSTHAGCKSVDAAHTNRLWYS